MHFPGYGQLGYLNRPDKRVHSWHDASGLLPRKCRSHIVQNADQSLGRRSANLRISTVTLQALLQLGVHHRERACKAVDISAAVESGAAIYFEIIGLATYRPSGAVIH